MSILGYLQEIQLDPADFKVFQEIVQHPNFYDIHTLCEATSLSRGRCYAALAKFKPMLSRGKIYTFNSIMLPTVKEFNDSYREITDRIESALDRGIPWASFDNYLAVRDPLDRLNKIAYGMIRFLGAKQFMGEER